MDQDRPFSSTPAAAILERESVPLRLRRLLDLESGLNDGLALPVVVVLLSLIVDASAHADRLVAELGLGAVTGLAVSSLFVWLQRRAFFEVAERYRPLAGAAIGITIFGLTRSLHLNEFLAAFAGGIAFASFPGPQSSRPAHEFLRLGEPLAEMLKLAALLIFGASIRPSYFASEWETYLFAFLCLIAARPAALFLSFLGRDLSRKEWLAAAWFGPKGFASILYALLMAGAGVSSAECLYEVVAIVVSLSIIAYSSTDVLVARVFCREARAAT